MPRIKRWFPVNHNINRDPQVWAMRRQIGEKSLSIWLEFLSIADQHDGLVPGEYDLLMRSIAGTCQATVRTVASVYQWGISQVWLKSEPSLHVVKYWNYHKRQESEKEPFPLPPDLPDLPDLPKKSPAKNAGAVDNSKADGREKDIKKLVALAVEIGDRDPARSQKLCQWTISIVRTLNGEPHERVLAVTRSCLENVRAKILDGYRIKDVWGLLDHIFNKERTKYMQGPENEAYKHQDIKSIGDILNQIAAKARSEAENTHSSPGAGSAILNGKTHHPHRP